ncbi:cytochrome d ubiquinol oxidase subunit II [Amantichitinum ursilacus]|uniref:Cytochrome bd-I ubiquinol oxidase subunit 2 n=1 Tax=Amantichitinum ursilacus TaxID=857265 RepID=A0A0N0GKY0_9NEIS|nr:cytochrome d ubiquinol oxidase subunit II [Amantichitinum ursilacus]KPC49337.1 Cytochrome bd-I ubiquinol oxidase subunit 2 [Amantichitinum ursilacus]
MELNLATVWAGIIALGVFIYAVMDGFDLGIGLLFAFFPDQHDRDVMVNTVAPVWDGNETWLVMGGAALFAAFPVAYSTILPALYLPLILMLTGLIFRGVAFEIRLKATRTRPLWDLAFMGGSAVATFFQGVALGTYLQGIPITNNQFAGGSFDWVSPFSIFTGMALMMTYSLLGCAWLLMKTDHKLQQRMFVLMKPLTLILLLVIAIVSLWTPLADRAVYARWFTLPNLFYFLPVPILVLACVFGIWRAVDKGNDKLPFLLGLALMGLGYSGFIISIWPNVVPPSLTFEQAAAPHSSMAFALVGAVIIIPIILLYTGLGYWVFRGKVRHGDEGYH